MLELQDLKCMGRFSVEVELENLTDVIRVDIGDLPPEELRRVRILGLVDTGATRLVLPESTVQQLGLPESGETTVRYADGRLACRKMAMGVRLTYGGRSGVFDAIVEPDRDSALIGAIVMETLDLLPDCTAQRLVPRDPDRIISEIE